jgi:hypothetical protein
MEVSARRYPPARCARSAARPCVRHRSGLRPGACFATLHVIDKFGAVSTISQTVRIGGQRESSIPR